MIPAISPGSDAMVTPRTGAVISFGVFFAISVFIAYLGAQKLSTDWALSSPSRAVTANAEVIEYHWARGGTATYRFVVAETGAAITNRASIDRWDYDDLARGKTSSIKVHYLRNHPNINAPSRGSDLNATGDIWLLFVGASCSLLFGLIGWLAWRKRLRSKSA